VIAPYPGTISEVDEYLAVMAADPPRPGRDHWRAAGQAAGAGGRDAAV